MIVSINQPSYLPWLGYFDRIRQSDLHIVLDHVQLEKGGFTNRNRIRQRDGRLMWLTVPVEHGQPINETRIAGKHWKRGHRLALAQTFGVPPVEIYDHDWLVELLADTTGQMCDRLGMSSAEWLRSSEMGGTKLGVKSELVLNLCKEVKATTYLSGPQGRNYLDLPTFDQAGIEVRYHDYPIPNPVLSAVHYLGESHARNVREDQGLPPGARGRLRHRTEPGVQIPGGS